MNYYFINYRYRGNRGRTIQKFVNEYQERRLSENDSVIILGLNGPHSEEDKNEFENKWKNR